MKILNHKTKMSSERIKQLMAEASNVSTSPGVDRSRLDQSGFSPVQSKIFLDRDRTSPTFRSTGAD